MTRFRQLLLASTTIGALATATTPPAHAQLAVFDGASVGHLIQSAAIGAKQLAELEAQLEQLKSVVGLDKQQLSQLMSLYTTFSHITNVSQLAPLLLEASNILPLPQLANAENLMRGLGFVGDLAGQAQAMLAKLQHFKATGDDFNANEMNTGALATAGQMTAAETLYKSQTDRSNGLADLELELARSDDPKQTADLTARIGIENGLAAAQGNQVAALQVMQRAQEDAQQERQDQAWRQGAESLVSDATAAGSVPDPGQ